MHTVVVKDITIGAGGDGFDVRAGEIRHSVANGSSPLRRFFGSGSAPPLVTRFDVIARVQ